MGFSPRFLDEVRERVSLARVVARRVKLARRGRNLFGLCPFHREKTPSFSVRDDEGFFHCFGCGASGDVFAYLMQTESLSFPEAVERLAVEAGLELPAPSPRERAAVAERKSLHEANEAGCAFYERMLREPAGRVALAYLRGRGLDDATIARFRLGYAPSARDALRQALLRESFDDSLLLAAGLLVEAEDGRPPRDRFRHRVTFPIVDRRGRVIAFGGRALGEGEPKYLNSPDTPIFRKGYVLYGRPEARRAAQERGEVIVAEGYMDVIALDRAGFVHAVAPLGTALTEPQLEELWRLAREPTLCFDGDEAGLRAAFRAAARALPRLTPGHSLKFALLPSGEDPDSLIATRGADVVSGLLRRAMPLAEFVWRMETAGKPVDTPERRAFLEKNLLARAREIADPGVRRYYERHFRDRLWAAFRARQGPARGRSSKEVPEVAAPGVGSTGGEIANEALRRERILVATILYHPGLLATLAEEFAAVDIKEGELDSLRRAILETAASVPDLDFTGLKGHLERRGFKAIVDRLAGTETRVLGWAALPDAAERDAELQWRQVLARHRQATLKAECKAAEEELAREMTSEEAWERVSALKRAIGEGEGDEADLEGYGEASGRASRG